MAIPFSENKSSAASKSSRRRSSAGRLRLRRVSGVAARVAGSFVASCRIFGMADSWHRIRCTGMIARRPRLTENRRSIIEQPIGEAIQNGSRESPAAEETAIPDIDDPKCGPDKEFMATLAKGLAVVCAFRDERPRLTLSQAAAEVGLSRATARRILLTLSWPRLCRTGRTRVLPRASGHGTRLLLSGQPKLDRSSIAAAADPKRRCRRDLLCVRLARKRCCLCR